ncbi:hypothetical protein DQ04_06761010 [Trypanosoma grayi]|uniref:hypothetical protein n=1 Tax=Trypanosoma grayi TaxID=71804 RepID=UPI0004F47093|nr:hypothetical protein DQ04_06761010 [Trypanosoma grayi]KEG08633.1 hypothetical protein DQ04_06761010 [Trypanosoma grayi]
MSGRLRGLLRRFVSPLVATRLTKEELCLSMAAVARLRLRQEDLIDIHLETIAMRAQRISHLCTPTELGMLSDGAAALFCTRADLADALISELYVAMMNSSPVRIGHVAAVVRYTDGVAAYSNETIPVILISAAQLLQKNDSPSVLESFMRLIQTHLPAAEIYEVLDELRKRATDEQRKCINSAHELPLINTAPHGKNKEAMEGDEDEEGESGWTAPRARRWISQQVRSRKAWTPTDVIQALELYAHFAVRDPVLHDKIENIMLSIIPTASKAQLDEIQKTLLTSVNLFPKVCEALRPLPTLSDDAHENGNDGKMHIDNSSTASSLAKTFRTTQAYDRVLMGRKVPEEWMFELMEEQDGTSPVDIAAQAACIFAEKGEVPEGIIVQLSTQLNALSPQGVAAFVRAVRRDHSGALLMHTSAVVRGFVAKGVQEASLDALLQLCRAWALPPPRGTLEDDKAVLHESHASLEEAVITRLLSVLRGSCSIPFMCHVAKASCAMDTNNEVVQFVCLNACARKDLTSDDALVLFDMLCCRGYVHESLLDILEPIFRGLVQSIASKMEGGVEVSGIEARQVATFATLQAAFDAPEFEAIACLLLRTVEQRISETPVEALPAAGLLCQRCRRDATAQAILEKVRGDMQRLSDESVGDLAKLLAWAKNTPEKGLVGELTDAVASRLSLRRALPPVVVGLAVIAHCRYCDAVDMISENVTDYLLEWIGALTSEVYTALCRTLHLYSAPESLANGIMDDFPRRLSLLTTKEIADVAFGLGEVTGVGQRLSHQLVAEKCSDYVVDHSHEFWSGKDIARLLYGLSRMHCTKRSLYNVFGTRLALRPILYSIDQEAISLAVSAFGRSKYLDRKLFDSFSRRILEQSNSLQAADLLLTIRGFSRVMLLNDQLYHELGSRAAEKAGEFPLESQCALLASFGSLGIEHEMLAMRMLDGIIEKMAELDDVNKVVNVLASLWQMNHEVESDARAAQLADWIAERSEELTGEAIGKLCSVLNDANWRHVPLVKAIAEQSVRLQMQQSVSAECCRAVLDTLGIFMIHHQGARENLSALGKSVSKEKIQLSEEEEQQIQLLLRR